MVSFLLTGVVLAQDTIVTFAQLEIRVPSPYTIISTSSSDIQIGLEGETSALTINTSTATADFPADIAEVMNASLAEPIDYTKTSLSGVPAITWDTPTGDSHMMVVWQGVLYDFMLSGTAGENPFLDDTESVWDEMIDRLYFDPLDAPVFIRFGTDIETLQVVPVDIGVTWELINRPDNSNLEFVQVLSNGEEINVEQPRDNPFISSSGEGTITIATTDDDAEVVDLQVRLRDLTDERLLAVSRILIPVEEVIVPTPSAPTAVTGTTNTATTETGSDVITQFDVNIDLDTQTATVTWTLNADGVDELRYQAVGANGQAIVEFLPTQTAGTYTFSGEFQAVDETNIAINGIATLAASISGTQSVASATITFGDEVAVDPNQPEITIFATTQPDAQVNTLPTQANVTWEVVNRPPQTNLQFVQVLPNNTFINAELPRPDPFIASTGSGMVNLVAADTYDLTGELDLTIRLRLVDANGTVLTSRDLVIPYVPN